MDRHRQLSAGLSHMVDALPQVVKHPPGWTSGLVIACLYGVCSASMAFANKAVLTSYNFNYPVFLVAVQMLMTTVALEIARLTGKTSLMRYTFEKGLSFLLPSLLYSANCVLSLSALSGMNIPMYGVIKRCSPAIILIMGFVVLRTSIPPRLISISIAMITGGCIIAGYGDLSFDLASYSYGLCSVLTQAGYLLLVQKNSQKVSAVELLHLNSINTLPILLVISVFVGEFGGACDTLRSGMTLGFHVTFQLVLVGGCLLNYLLFLCTTHNSALTTSVTGAVKSVGQTAVGMFTFGGIAINVFTLSGIFLNLFGGILYTFVKYKASEAKQPTSTTADTVGAMETNAGAVEVGLMYGTEEEEREKSVQ